MMAKDPRFAVYSTRKEDTMACTTKKSSKKPVKKAPAKKSGKK